MQQLEWKRIHCPYCGESFAVEVDLSGGAQAYIEDCQICCRPLEMRLFVAGSQWSLEVKRDDD